MNKIAITIIAAILTCSLVAAQDFTRHEFSVNAGGGFSGLQTRPTIGKDHWRGAWTTGLGYQYLFNPNWSIGAGINFSVYQGKMSIKDYHQSQIATNRETGHTFDFEVSSPHYREKQRVMMVTIPVIVQYQYPLDEQKSFYTAFGLKTGIPVSAKSRSKGNFTTKGYYPNLDVTYEDLPEYGFVTNQPFPENKTTIRLKASVMASAECGMKWRLAGTTSLYTGIYADYGFNNMLKNNDKTNKNLVVHQTQSPAQFAYHSAAHMYARNIKPFAVGVTLRYAFGVNGKTRNLPDNNIVEIQPPDVAEPEIEPIVEDEPEPQVAEPEPEAIVDEADTQKQIEEERLARELEEQRLAAEKARLEEEENARKKAELKQQSIDLLQQPIVNFKLGKVASSDPQIEALDKRVEILKQNPDLIIFIYGHTCDTGTHEANEKVGLSRAQQAKEYMISQGVSENQIRGIASKRDTEPLVPNTNEENRKINRRVEMRIVN